MIVFAPEALDDLETIFAFNEAKDSGWAVRQVQSVRRAVMLLEEHPLMGRPGEGELCELVVSVGKRGFVVLYEYDALDHFIRVLAVRHQREAGYRGR